MNPLKMFFVLLAMVIAGNSHVQTQEETIVWLRENLDYHFHQIMENDKKNEVDSVEDCGFICWLSWSEKYTENRLLQIETINACEIKMRVGNATTLTIPLRGLVSHNNQETEKFHFKQKQKIIKNEYLSTNGWKVIYTDFTPTLINDAIAPKLSEKIAKAIKHLSSFCIDKEAPF